MEAPGEEVEGKAKRASRRLMHDKMSLHWPRRDNSKVCIVGHTYEAGVGDFSRRDVGEDKGDGRE